MRCRSDRQDGCQKEVIVRDVSGEFASESLELDHHSTVVARPPLLRAVTSDDVDPRGDGRRREHETELPCGGGAAEMVPGYETRRFEGAAPSIGPPSKRRISTFGLRQTMLVRHFRDEPSPPVRHDSSPQSNGPPQSEGGSAASCSSAMSSPDLVSSRHAASRRAVFQDMRVSIGEYASRSGVSTVCAPLRASGAWA